MMTVACRKLQERAAAAQEIIRNHNTAKQRPAAPSQPVYEQPVYVQPVYNQPTYEEPAYDQPTYEHSAPQQYEQSMPEQYEEPSVRHSDYQSSSMNIPPPQHTAAMYRQTVPNQSNVVDQSVHELSCTASQDAPFDVDAWLADLNVGSKPQKQINASSGQLAPKVVPNGNQQSIDASQNGARSRHSPDSGRSQERYMPPHMRSDTGPDVSAIDQARRLPPGFGGI